jgi:hypothetical protein
MSTSMSIRRIVTGHDSSGRAVVAIDDRIGGRRVAGGAAEFAVIWKSTTTPADNYDPVDHANEPGGLTQVGGGVLRVVDTSERHTA